MWTVEKFLLITDSQNCYIYSGVCVRVCVCCVVCVRVLCGVCCVRVVCVCAVLCGVCVCVLCVCACVYVCNRSHINVEPSANALHQGCYHARLLQLQTSHRQKWGVAQESKGTYTSTIRWWWARYLAAYTNWHASCNWTQHMWPCFTFWQATWLVCWTSTLTDQDYIHIPLL